MTTFLSIRIRSEKELPEQLSSELDQLGFDGIIEHNENDLEAFIDESLFDKIGAFNELDRLKNDFQLEIQISELEEKNWNETWESSFEPVEIERKLRIRAPFHSFSPDFDIDILIEPKMSFGTGHHGTTFLMAQLLLEYNPAGKNVLDAGSGTGLLAILAEKLGASKVTGFDIEDWAFNNSVENLELNNCTNTSVFKGDANGLPYDQSYFDLIVANITKNILKEDIPVYLNYLRPGGTLMISGFFEEDMAEMTNFSKKLGLEVTKTKTKNNWAAIELKN